MYAGCGNRTTLLLQCPSSTAEEIIIGEAGAGGGAESDLARAIQLSLQLELRTRLGASTLLWRPDPEAALDDDPELRAGRGAPRHGSRERQEGAAA